MTMCELTCHKRPPSLLFVGRSIHSTVTDSTGLQVKGIKYAFSQKKIVFFNQTHCMTALSEIVPSRLF